MHRCPRRSSGKNGCCREEHLRYQTIRKGRSPRLVHVGHCMMGSRLFSSPTNPILAWTYYSTRTCVPFFKAFSSTACNRRAKNLPETSRSICGESSKHLSSTVKITALAASTCMTPSVFRPLSTSVSRRQTTRSKCLHLLALQIPSIYLCTSEVGSLLTLSPSLDPRLRSSKNELINWLYHYMKQKDVLQRYYRSPDALVLVQMPATFNLFDRIMAQLEKLSPLAFRLTYRPAPIPFDIDEQLNMSTISIHSTKASPREWVMNISRRASRTSTQPIVQPTMTPTNPAPSTDTMRSTLTRKLNSLFTKTNPAPPQRKVSSAVTARLPAPKADRKSVV